MTPNDWELIGENLERLSSLDTEAREAALQALSEELPHLYPEIRSLMENHDKAGGFLDTPAFTSELEFGNFQCLRLLGQGTFAQVYLALDRGLNRHVALKVSSNFGEEARTMGALEHPNIVRVFSEHVDNLRGLRWISMQYVAGNTLERLRSEVLCDHRTRPATATIADWLFRHAESSFRGGESSIDSHSVISSMEYEEWVLWVGMKVADALHFAHERGVLHLDIKPANILLDARGRPLLTDFNVSTTKELASRVGPVLGGTRKYMSPEQAGWFSTGSAATHAAPDARSDVYSLGKVLDQLLPAGTEASDHEDLVWLIDKACAADPRNRFQSAEEMAQACQRLLHARKLKQQLPPLGVIAAGTLRYPSLVGLFIFLPELAGSLINISYNMIWIVDKLRPEQQAVFEKLVLLYNVAVYPAAVLYLALVVRPLTRSLRASSRDILSWPPGQQESHVYGTIRFLPRVFATTAFGWLPGILFFPGLIHAFTGGVSADVYFHFAVSFILSWAIALTYSSVYVQYIVLRLLYPKLFFNGVRIGMGGSP